MSIKKEEDAEKTVRDFAGGVGSAQRILHGGIS
jgi:hypothetical protein